MKLIALSDIHGAYDKAKAILSAEWPWDGLIIAGDLTTNGSESEAGEAIDMLLSFGAPVAGVCGNMDPSRLERVFASREISVNARGVLWGEIGIFGVSGSPPTPMHTPYEISEADIAEHAQEGWTQVSSARVTVFVPHAPPHKTAVDRIRGGHHVGSTAVRTFIEKKKPTVTICGHIHEARGVDTIGPTTIVNCGPAMSASYAVLDLSRKPTVTLKP